MGRGTEGQRRVGRARRHGVAARRGGGGGTGGTHGHTEGGAHAPPRPTPHSKPSMGHCVGVPTDARCPSVAPRPRGRAEVGTGTSEAGARRAGHPGHAGHVWPGARKNTEKLGCLGFATIPRARQDGEVFCRPAAHVVWSCGLFCVCVIHTPPFPTFYPPIAHPLPTPTPTGLHALPATATTTTVEGLAATGVPV